ncbi:hypothetical protein HMPREF3198_00690 [Winkia neuii]|nr:hypothetical protein HMPREF3198_00690 [Winkia neuii]
MDKRILGRNFKKNTWDKKVEKSVSRCGLVWNSCNSLQAASTDFCKL